MESITVPIDDTKIGPLAEVKQVSVDANNDVAPVNELLASGWKLLHIGRRMDGLRAGKTAGTSQTTDRLRDLRVAHHCC